MMSLFIAKERNYKEAKFEQESIFPLSVFYLHRRRSNGNTVSSPLLTEKVILIALLLLVWYGKRPAGAGTQQYKLSFSEEFLSFQISYTVRNTVRLKGKKYFFESERFC